MGWSGGKTIRSTTNSCLKCRKKAANLRCSRCRKAKYCCKECQRADWKSHKPACAPWPSR
ncbi:unnamed protein product [Sphacelaria rigidula]